MLQQVLIISFVLISALLLVGLIWWRFYGGGKEVSNINRKSKPANYKSLKTYRYEVRDFLVPLYESQETVMDELESPILDELINEEDYLDEKNTEETSSEESTENIPADPKIISIIATVHSDSVTDGHVEESPVPDESKTYTQDVFLKVEQEDNPAPSLYYNPITAPALTDNDKKNREAEIAMKRRRRAELKNSTSAVKTGFNELFSPDSSVKSPLVKEGT